MNEQPKKRISLFKKISIISIICVIILATVFFAGLYIGRSGANDGTGVSNSSQAEIDTLREQNSQLRDELTGIRIINQQLTGELNRLSEFSGLLRDINRRLDSYIGKLQGTIDELRLLRERDRELIESLGSDLGGVGDLIDLRLQALEAGEL